MLKPSQVLIGCLEVISTDNNDKYSKFIVFSFANVKDNGVWTNVESLSKEYNNTEITYIKIIWQSKKN